ncbi:hypothetical protein ACU4GD_11645 [Cupriavidus basilensis]
MQFLLAVTWTLYLAFLPQLAAQAGIPREHAAWILLMDQVIFVAMDCALGIAADRVANAMRHLGGWILAMTVASCAAFVLLPHAISPVLLIGLTAVWAATSSALRAPPMVIISRSMKTSATPFLWRAPFSALASPPRWRPRLLSGCAAYRRPCPLSLQARASSWLCAALRWAGHCLRPLLTMQE